MVLGKNINVKFRASNQTEKLLVSTPLFAQVLHHYQILIPIQKGLGDIQGKSQAYEKEPVRSGKEIKSKLI